MATTSVSFDQSGQGTPTTAGSTRSAGPVESKLAIPGARVTHSGKAVHKVTMTEAGTNVESSGVQQVKVGPQPVAGSAFNGARDQHGYGVHSGEIADDTILKVGGMEVTAQEAHRAGLLDRLPSGHYVEKGAQQPMTGPQAAQEPQAQQSQQKQQQAPTSGPAIQQETEQVMTRLNAVAPSAAVNAFVDILQTGKVADDTAATIGDALGVDRDMGHAFAHGITADFQQQANAVMSDFGLDDEVFEWAKEHRATQLKTAAHRHFQERDLSGYQTLAREYLTNLPTIDGDGLMAGKYKMPTGSGWQVMRDSRGRVMLDTPEHGPIEWAAAVSAGMFHRSRHRR